MKFALIDGVRREPDPGLVGQCPGCEQDVLAKCGEFRVWHWAHKGKRACDTWWEPETEWHRAWKNLFPVEWQEVPMRADDGELHIADVRTPQGLVIEFQHSAIKADEQNSRELFYRKMLWIIDGSRLKQDRPRIDRNLSGWRRLKENFISTSMWPDEFLPKRWLNSNVPVLFDFDGLARVEDFAEEFACKPASVLRDEEWWNSRGACGDPLICILPYRYRNHALYFPVDRQRFSEIVTEETKIFDYRIVHQMLRDRDAEVEKRNRGRRRGRRF